MPHPSRASRIAVAAAWLGIVTQALVLAWLLTQRAAGQQRRDRRLRQRLVAEDH